MTVLVNYLEAIYITRRATAPVEHSYGSYRGFSARYTTLKSSYFVGFLRRQNSEQNTAFHKPDLLPPSDKNVEMYLHCWTKQNDYFSHWPSVIFGKKTSHIQKASTPKTT